MWDPNPTSKVPSKNPLGKPGDKKSPGRMILCYISALIVRPAWEHVLGLLGAGFGAPELFCPGDLSEGVLNRSPLLEMLPPLLPGSTLWGTWEHALGRPVCFSQEIYLKGS